MSRLSAIQLPTSMRVFTLVFPSVRSTFIEHPRKRPIIQKPDSHFDLFEMPRKVSPLRQPIVTSKFPSANVAIIEPSQNIHEAIRLNEPACTYLRQPEVRRARHEILKKKRPPSPSKSIASAMKYERMKKGLPVDSDEENRIFMEKSRMVTPTPSPPVLVTVENVDDPNAKPITLLRGPSPKFGRRASFVQRSPSVDARSSIHSTATLLPPAQATPLHRNYSKIIEGNREYGRNAKKASITSTITTTTMASTDNDPSWRSMPRKLSHSQSVEEPRSFVVLKNPHKTGKWMKSNWYQ